MLGRLSRFAEDFTGLPASFNQNSVATSGLAAGTSGFSNLRSIARVSLPRGKDPVGQSVVCKRSMSADGTTASPTAEVPFLLAPSRPQDSTAPRGPHVVSREPPDEVLADFLDRPELCLGKQVAHGGHSSRRGSASAVFRKDLISRCSDPVARCRWPHRSGSVLQRSGNRSPRPSKHGPNAPLRIARSLNVSSSSGRFAVVESGDCCVPYRRCPLRNRQVNAFACLKAPEEAECSGLSDCSERAFDLGRLQAIFNRHGRAHSVCRWRITIARSNRPFGGLDRQRRSSWRSCATTRCRFDHIRTALRTSPTVHSSAPEVRCTKAETSATAPFRSRVRSDGTLFAAADRMRQFSGPLASADSSAMRGERLCECGI